MFNLKQTTLLPLLLLALTGCDSSEQANETTAPKQPKPRPVNLITVGEMAAENTQHFPATLSANKEVAISFQVPGKLVQFDIKPGDEIKQGELLASVDNRDYVSQLDITSADHRLAQAQFQRVENLFKKKLISRAEFDVASAQLKSAKAALKLAKDRVSYSKVHAPFSGQVAATFVENHQYVQPQQTLLLLQDVEILNVVIQLPTNILLALNSDNINLDYQPTAIIGTGKNARSFPITYKQHSTQASLGTQSYEVVYTMENPQDMTLYSGMGATVSIDFNQAMTTSNSRAYLVPVSAVLPDDVTGLHHVWLYDEQAGTVSPVPVSVGEIIGQNISITGDLKAKDTIVTAGLTSLKDGMAVKPLTRERGL